MSDDKDKTKDDKSKKAGKSKNPWGSNAPSGSAGGKKSNGWTVYSAGGSKSGGSRMSGGAGAPPPEMDEMLRKARENFGQVIPGGFGSGSAVLILLLAIVGLWAVTGFYIVNPGENAVIQRFGAWERTQADPGLGYRFPAPVEAVTILNVQEVQKMNIGFMEVFSRGGQSTKRDIAAESLMLTSDRNIVDLDLVLQWNIKSAEDYLFNIDDQENTIKKVAESAIREVVGQTNMFPVITNQRQDVADRVKAIIQQNLDEYHSGVNISDVLIERAEVHPDVQAAFQDVQSAKQDAEDVINRAEAYREDILPKARGAAIKMVQQAEAYKQSTVARANGDAERFDAIYESYLTGKDVTKERLYLETMENVLGNAQKIILDNDAGSGVVPYLPLNELKKGN
jgi:membrane protease subunit HflK